MWGIPYPCSGDTIDPSIFCDFSTAVDAALTTLAEQATFVQNRPNARADRTAPGNTFAVGVATNMQLDTETFDNDGMVNLVADSSAITIQTPGLYWATMQVGGMGPFTTWTTYRLAITQNGTSRISRKFVVVLAQATPSDQSIYGVLVCQAGDVLRGQYTWTGSGGPQGMTRGSLSASFICDL